MEKELAVTPLRPWMKIAIRLAIVFNILLGVLLIAFYHEGCLWLRFPKLAVVWPLQLAGVIALLCGLGYRLVLAQPTKYRRFLLVNFIAHAVASTALAYGISTHRLSLNFLPLLLAIVAIDLWPMARLLPRLFISQGILTAQTERPTGSTVGVWKSDSTRSHTASTPLRLVSIALLITAFLPPSWAVAHLASDAEARWAAQRRPAKWQPLAANLPTKPSDELPFAAIDAWPQLRFTDPTFICQIPDGSGRMAVTERVGRIRVFSLKTADANSKTESAQVYLDITDRTMQVPHRAEDGLLCLAFHPHFADAASPQRGWLFVRYTANVQGQRMNRLSRFVVPMGADRPDPKSESVLIELPEKTVVHKGGALAFGLDGYLYTTFGTDGEVIPNDHAQRIDEALWAGVLRLDVDCQGGEISHAPPRQPSVGKTANYFVPNDNPFVGLPRAMEEFFSIGFRNPWRMTIDRQTGQIWVGDVGDRRREEIDICSKGSNHQWDYMEGTLPTQSYAAQAPGRPEHVLGVEMPPVFEYPHDGLNHCVIGGYVYRGKKLPQLFGKYIYADQGGRIYALTVDAENHFVANELIAGIGNDGLGASSWGEDADGELYLCTIRDLAVANSPIYRLEKENTRAGSCLAGEALRYHFVQRSEIAETQCQFDSVRSDCSAVVGSGNQAALDWFDLAGQNRWRCGRPLEIPQRHGVCEAFRVAARRAIAGSQCAPLGNSRISVWQQRHGLWRCLPLERGANRRATGRFARDGRDLYVDHTGQRQTQTWTYPGRFDCNACHSNLAGGVLGFNARQLNREVCHDGIAENQMAKFAVAGMFGFDASPSAMTRVPKLSPLADLKASVEQRVRSYFDANCSHCHQDGGRFGLWDARIELPLARQGIIDGLAVTHHGANPNARVVSPGNLDMSFLYVRMTSQESQFRMPPLGRGVVHQEAAELVKQWIESMPPLAGTTTAPVDTNSRGQDRQ